MLDFSEPVLLEEAPGGAWKRPFDSGRQPRRFEAMIEAQGGDPRVVADPSRLPQPRQTIPARSPRGGYVPSISTEKMGFLAIDIGCGRRRREDEIDPAAGFLVEKTSATASKPGEPLAWCAWERPRAPGPAWSASSRPSSRSATRARAGAARRRKTLIALGYRSRNRTVTVRYTRTSRPFRVAGR